MDKKQTKKISFRRMLEISWFAFKLYIKPDKVTGVMLFIVQIVWRTKAMVNFLIVAKIINQASVILQGGQNVDSLVMPLIVLVLFNFFSASINIAEWYLNTKMWQKFNLFSDIIIFDHFKTLGVPILEDPENNNIINRGKNEIGQISNLFYQFVYFVSELINAVVAGVAVFLLLPSLVWVVFAWTAIKNIQGIMFTKRVYQYTFDNTEYRRRNRTIMQYLLYKVNMIELSMYNATSHIRKIYTDFLDKYFSGWLAIRKWNYKYEMGFSFFDIFVNFWIYFSIIMKVVAAKLLIGQLYFYISMANRFAESLNSLFTDVVGLYEVALRIDDVRLFFELKPNFPDGNLDIKILAKPPKIVVDNISFKYPNSEKYVLKDFDLTINAGEKIAIVGINGSGKTTLIKLLLRFYQVSKGNIFVNDDNIDDLKIESYYNNVGALFQDFGGYGAFTAEENIFLGDTSKKLKRKDIMEAAKKSDAHDFINEYKNKYSQILSEGFEGGIRPSDGQWQKIAISRLFYRNPWLVIFDEPTASIDAEAEYKIFNNIYNFFDNKTVIIISHRFSTVRNADRIILIDGGKILEQGSHEELLKLNGKYAKSFKLQADGYKE